MLADANILTSRTLRDYFVYAAKLGALDIHWSATILDEVTRNLISRFGFSREDASVLVERLGLFLPSALVEVKKRDMERQQRSTWTTRTDMSSPLLSPPKRICC